MNIGAFLPILAQADLPEIFGPMEREPTGGFSGLVQQPWFPFVEAAAVLVVMLVVYLLVNKLRPNQEDDRPDFVLRRRMRGLRQADLPADALPAAIAAILRDALAWRYKLPVHTMTQRELNAALQQRSNIESSAPAIDLLSECEQARYSGQVPEGDLVQRADDALEALLTAGPINRGGQAL